MKFLYLLILSISISSFSFGAIPLQADTLYSFDDVEFTDGQDTGDTASSPSAELSPDTTGNTFASGNTPSTLWGIFIAGIIGGFAAFLMPCIYPMVPLTVSFFTKQSGTRSKGIINALLYALFIIVIYVALGMV